MPARSRSTAISHRDVLILLEQINAERGVRVRLSIVSLSTNRRKQGFALLATPYAANGRRLTDVASEQLLWPSDAHRTFEGACVYLLHRLDAALVEWEDTQMRNLSHLPQGALSPLEQYIANSSLTATEE